MLYKKKGNVSSDTGHVYAYAFLNDSLPPPTPLEGSFHRLRDFWFGLPWFFSLLYQGPGASGDSINRCCSDKLKSLLPHQWTGLSLLTELGLAFIPTGRAEFAGLFRVAEPKAHRSRRGPRKVSRAGITGQWASCGSESHSSAGGCRLASHSSSAEPSPTSPYTKPPADTSSHCLSEVVSSWAFQPPRPSCSAVLVLELQFLPSDRSLRRPCVQTSQGRGSDGLASPSQPTVTAPPRQSAWARSPLVLTLGPVNQAAKPGPAGEICPRALGCGRHSEGGHVVSCHLAWLVWCKSLVSHTLTAVQLCSADLCIFSSMSSLPSSGREHLRVPTGQLYTCPVCMALPTPGNIHTGSDKRRVEIRAPLSAVYQETNETTTGLVGSVGELQHGGQGPGFERTVRCLRKLRERVCPFA